MCGYVCKQGNVNKVLRAARQASTRCVYVCCVARCEWQNMLLRECRHEHAVVGASKHAADPWPCVGDKVCACACSKQRGWTGGRRAV